MIVELLLRNRLRPARDEHRQKFECFRRKRQLFPTTQELTRGRIDQERRETSAHRYREIVGESRPVTRPYPIALDAKLDTPSPVREHHQLSIPTDASQSRFAWSGSSA